MVNQKIIDRFEKEAYDIWFKALAPLDCLILKTNKHHLDLQIDKEIEENVRKYFITIADDEVILFVRDTSFFSTKDQGCIITDQRIHIISDNSNKDSLYFIEWADVESVKIHKGKFRFSSDENDSIDLDPKLFLKKNSKDIELQQKIADFLNNIASLAINTIKEAIQKIYEDDTPEEECLRIAKEMIGQKPEYDGLFEFFIGCNAFDNEDYENAMHSIKKALQCEYLSDEQLCIAKMIMGKIGLFTNEPLTREWLWDVVSDNISNSLTFDEHKTFNEEALECIKAYDEKLISNINMIPQYLRKFLVPVKDYDMFKNDKSLPSCLVSLDALHTSNLSFPSGHPIAGQVYVSHPVIPHRYILLEDHELEITEEKIREFCYFVQCLGAKRLSITSSYSNATNSTERNTSSKGVKTSYNQYTVGAGSNDSTYKRLGEWLRHVMQFNQEFNPVAQPYIPDDLVWLDQEPSWKRLAKQRMKGSLISHHELLDIKKSIIIQNNEIKELLGSFKYTLIEIEGYLKNYKSSTEKSEENVFLDIEVTFWPIDVIKEMTSREVIENERLIDQLIKNYTNPVYMANLNAPDNIEDLLEVLHFLQKEKSLKKHYKRIYQESELIFGDDPVALNKIKMFKPKNIFGF